MKRSGVREPIIVTPHGAEAGRFQIVAGERRWRAAQLAGLSEIPCIVDPGLIERRIGRWLGRFPAAERLLAVVVERNAAGQATGLKICEVDDQSAIIWTRLTKNAAPGVNCTGLLGSR